MNGKLVENYIKYHYSECDRARILNMRAIYLIMIIELWFNYNTIELFKGLSSELRNYKIPK